MFTRLLYGGRITLAVALAATALMFVLGCTAGFAAAVAGGWIDTILARTCDALMAIPTLIFALVLLSVVGSSVPILICTLAVLGSTRVFRISRALAGNIVAQEYFEVARLRGEGPLWLMFCEILPNALPPLTAEFGLRLCSGFLFIAALSFLGLGIQPPLADWGGMVRDNASASCSRALRRSFRRRRSACSRSASTSWSIGSGRPVGASDLMAGPILSIEGLRIEADSRGSGGEARPLVDGISLAVERGEVWA